MARNEPDDIDSLLAEVERSLSPTASAPAKRSSKPPARTSPAAPSAPAEDQGSGGVVEWLTRRLTVAVAAGGVCAGLVFLLFFLTPFTGAISGALGAAIAGFVTALLLPRRL